MLAHKIKRIREMLAGGRYKEILYRTLLHFVPYKLAGRITKNTKYLYLRSKFRKFIEQHKKESAVRKESGHENIIWWCWLQGLDNAPEICRVCLDSLRYWHPEKKIIILDSKNISDYITLPDYIIQKYERGNIIHAHYSDLVRLQLLTEYGGTWIDSTIYCTGRKFEHIMSLPLFVFRGDSFATPLSNWFLVSDPHNPIIEMTKDLLFAYWKNYDRAIDYFMFHMFFRMSTEAYSDEYSKMPYMSNQPPKEMGRSRYNDYTEEKMKHFAEISDFHKLTYKHQYGVPPSSTSIYQHIIDSWRS